ncbi:MAG TPA: hypothetical protein VK002_04590 [Rubricoccaceae bacterium]|jgi:hypothetical protein|nr:hypothetical protein [Rubricoccaceae bacterium]
MSPLSRTFVLALTLGLVAFLLPGCDSFLFFGDSEGEGVDCPVGDLECYCEQHPENC